MCFEHGKVEVVITLICEPFDVSTCFFIATVFLSVCIFLQNEAYEISSPHFVEFQFMVNLTM